MIKNRKLILEFTAQAVVGLAKSNDIPITEDEAVMVMAKACWEGSDRKAVEEVLMIYIQGHYAERKREAENVQVQNP